MRWCFNYNGKTRIPTLDKVADRKIISQALVYLLYISNSLKSFKVLKIVFKAQLFYQSQRLGKNQGNGFSKKMSMLILLQITQ